ncbi:MAG: hypothetical protein ACR2P0_17690 [Acidimicrobiales bacterium]
MEYQFREYVIHPGRADQFAAEWAADVKPLRESAGFVIAGAWVLPSQDKFVWILGWPGPGTLASADSQYYESPGRSKLDPDPARLITVAEEITPVIDALQIAPIL